MKYLDPNDLGRINFKDFCRGVFAMKGKVLWGNGSRGSQDPVQLGRLTCLGFQLRVLPVGVPGAHDVFGCGSTWSLRGRILGSQP